MENREITLADIFLDILSESQDKGAKLMAERIKAAIMQLIVLSVLYTLKLIVVIYRIMIKRKKRIHTNTLQKVSVKY